MYYVIEHPRPRPVTHLDRGNYPACAVRAKAPRLTSVTADVTCLKCWDTVGMTAHLIAERGEERPRFRQLLRMHDARQGNK